jgi:hypothetical protein
MIPKTITITLPVMSAHDAAEIGKRVGLLDGYTRAMAVGMGLAPYDALQPAALLAATHGLNNELSGIIASLAPSAKVTAAEISAVNELADKQADIALDFAELLRNFRDVAHDLKKAALFASEAMGRGSEN